MENNGDGSLSVVIPTKNEEKMIGKIMIELKKLNPLEIIVVDNGSNDSTKEIAEQMGARVIPYDYALGKNVPRAIGAYHAKGDIILFIDGDQLISSVKLKPFIKSIKDGADIALNDFSWLLKLKRRPHCTAIARKALNLFLDREDLDLDSFVSIPHAMSKQALETIGWWNLAETGVTLTIAILENLKIESPLAINVLKNNAFRRIMRRKVKNSPFAIAHESIIGDHVLALHFLMSKKGVRGGFSDDRLNETSFNIEVEEKLETLNISRSTVIDTTKGRSNSLLPLIKRLEIANVNEILIISDNKNSLSDTVISNKKVKVQYINGSEGSYYARFLASEYVNGKSVLFIDGDFLLSLDQIDAFYNEIENNSDIALNDKGYLLGNYPIDSKSTIHYFLNILMKRPELINFSLTEYPHALRKKVLDIIPHKDFEKPPVAYVKALLSDFSITAPCRVKTNEKDVVCDQVFLGDHLEAISILLEKTNKKGGFYDGKKKEAISEIIEREGK